MEPPTEEKMGSDTERKLDINTEEEIMNDDYYVRKCMNDNYALEFWLKAGGVFSVGKNGYIVNSITALYLGSANIVLPLLILTAIKHFDDMEIVCEAVHFSVILVLEQIFLVSCISNRGVIKELLTINGKGFYDYENTMDNDSIQFITKILAESKRKKEIIAKLFIATVMCACLSVTILRPVTRFLFGEHLIGSPDDGLLRIMPTTMWTPFYKHSWYVMAFFFFTHDVIGYVTPGIVFGISLFILCTCEDVGNQFLILGQLLKTVERRAEGLSMPKEEALKLCFKHSIRHHQTLLSSIKTLETILYIPGLGLLVGSSILMCMSGFIFVSKEVSFVSKFVFCSFLLSELLLIFIICWCGENIQNTSSQVFELVYSSDWPSNIKSMKLYILIIQIRTLNPIKISFGGIMVASLETYSNICSSAFSYFNILLAVN